MVSIFMEIGNMVIVKTSPYSSFSVRAAAKEAYIYLWESRGDERIG